jgi:putative (di)nucleoside polyphosphate hydrolase
MPHSHLPYRLNVGIMVLNAEGKIWIGRRPDSVNDPEGRGTWWQMPQGGIDANEDPRAAALRELYEETNIKSATIIGEAKDWHNYDLPAEVINRAWGGKYRGQSQKWFAARFTGPESEISITPPPGHDIEFIEWRWAAIDELPALIVPFKRGVYTAVLAEFRPLTVLAGPTDADPLNPF